MYLYSRDNLTFNGDSWEKVDETKNILNYLHMSDNSVEILENPFHETLSLWDSQLISN